MRLLFRIFTLLIFNAILLYSSMAYSKSAAIAARINDQVITLQELEDRIWFAKKFNPETNNFSTKSLTYNILDELIEEVMINQEAQRVGLSIDEKELDLVMHQIKYGQAKLYKKIQSSKNPILANKILENKIKTNLIWSKILSEIVKPSIKNINKAQIIETLEQLDKNTEEYKFNISQISIKKSPENKILIDKIYKELINNNKDSQEMIEIYKKQNILSFLDIGWVSKSNLDQNIYQELFKNKERKYTSPIKTNNEYVIFKINQKILSNHISPSDYELAQNKIYNSLKISDGQGFLSNLKRRTFIEIYRNRIDRLNL